MLVAGVRDVSTLARDQGELIFISVPAANG